MKKLFVVSASIIASLAVTSIASPVLAAGVAPSSVSGASAYYRADLGYMVGWTTPANKSGITGYTVTATPTGKTCKVVGATANLCTFPNSALTYGSTYTFSVVSDGVGVSSVAVASNPIKPASIPGGPVYVSSNVASDTQLDVAWVPSASEGGAPLYGYKVTYWKSDNAGTPINSTRVEKVVTTTSTSLTGLAPSTMYIVNVAACNAYGCNSANFWAYEPTTPLGTPSLLAVKLPTLLSGGSADTVCFDEIFDASTGVTKSATKCASLSIDPATYPAVVPGATSIVQPVLATKFNQRALLTGLTGSFSMATWSKAGGISWFVKLSAQTKSVVNGFTTPVTIVATTPTCSVVGSVIVLKSVGACTINASVAGDNAFLPSNTATSTFTITN